MTSGSTSAISSYQWEVRKSPDRHRYKTPPPGFAQPCPASKRQRPHHRKLYAQFSEGINGWNPKPHTMCMDCFRSRLSRLRNGQQETNSSSVSSISEQQSPQVVAQISGISLPTVEERPEQLPAPPLVSTHSTCTPVKLSRHIFTGEWRCAILMSHPTMELALSVRNADYKPFSKSCPNVD